MSLSALKSLGTFNVHRLLRKNFIERLVLVMRIALIAVIVLCMVLVARAFLDSSRTAETRVQEFNSKIALAKQEASAPVPGAKKTDVSVIAAKSIFGPVGAATPVAAAQATAKPVTNLPMTLIGTFLTDGQAPYAIIEEQKKKTQDVFNIGDMVFGEAKLVAVFEDRVEIERNSKIEVLALDNAPDRGPEMKGGVGVLGDSEFIVEEGELDKALENLPLLLTQARAVPFFKEGRAVGLRLFAIKNGSLFERIGLQNGDVLKAINGSSLADLSQAMQLFQKLKDERTITVVMERNLVEKELKYHIK